MMTCFDASAFNPSSVYAGTGTPSAQDPYSIHTTTTFYIVYRYTKHPQGPHRRQGPIVCSHHHVYAYVCVRIKSGLARVKHR